MDVQPIAHICSDFSEKFGIPRQSGLVEELTATVVFEPAYRDLSALRGLEGFSHLWLIWEFSQARREGTGGWGCSPPAPPSGPTPWGCPASGCWRYGRTGNRGPFWWWPGPT